MRVSVIRSSPRPWRCFSLGRLNIHAQSVFSTSVEVFLSSRRIRTTRRCLLHVRGGVSAFTRPGFVFRPSSPRPWRCFSERATFQFYFRVFSTSVEVFPILRGRSTSASSLLHVRGGVSKTGGVPERKALSSPRPWRCFYEEIDGKRMLVVFSTSVEVFLQPCSTKDLVKRLLHVRGGVSLSFLAVLAID